MNRRHHITLGVTLTPTMAGSFAVRESVNKSAASAASLDYVKFQAVIKSAASAASQIQGTQVQGSAGRRGAAARRIGARATDRGAPCLLYTSDAADE